ncbi:metabotropic glutamate receptor 6-like [Pollicipes pollicipes]|uniref:metabotropic glutamate receptor 6-like n=1 Tax=Pollicipes pollicipes TaxID=41117 RepID=UPI001884BE0B|nr:metabotropic glutamate receptor 6-like [Pollicipes pollicipes]
MPNRAAVAFGASIAAALRGEEETDGERQPAARSGAIGSGTRAAGGGPLRAKHHDRFLWVASDSWGAKVHPVRNQEHVAEGAITILPQRTTVPGFDEYFKLLRPWVRPGDCRSGKSRKRNIMNNNINNINCRNVWFREFWSQLFNCTFDKTDRAGNRCSGREELTKYKQEGLVPFVVDAVYALAHALHNMILAKCGSIRLCDELRPVPAGQELLQYIRNVSFIGKQKRQVRFDENGDATGFYNIYQFQKRDGKYEYYQIGEWVESLNNLSTSKMKWRGDTNTTPSSICSTPCPLGKIRNYQVSGKHR